MTPADRQRIAHLTAWRAAWLGCAAWVRYRAEGRAVAAVNRLTGRFVDLYPRDLPQRRQHRYRRNEDLYAVRLQRAVRHERRADECAREIARIKAEAKTRMPAPPTQPDLFSANGVAVGAG
jgi:hypothetical protein